MPVQDNETKAGIFPGKVISVEHGKLVAMSKSMVATGPRIGCHPLVTVITLGQQALELLVALVGGGPYKHIAPGWALFSKNAAL